MRWGMLWVVAAVLALATSSHAAILTYDLNVEFSGATAPAGPAPWLRATFDDGGSSGSVTLTLTALNLVDEEYVRLWYLNLDPTLNPANLVFSAPLKTGTFADPLVDLGTDQFQADGDGLYDMRFTFANAPLASRFGPGNSVQYTITGIASLTASSFDFFSTAAGGNGPFRTAAHVQGIAPNGDNSGWITEVPEPSALGVLVIGAVALLRRRA